MERAEPLVLTGQGLNAALVAEVARRGRRVEIDPAGRERMVRSRAVVEDHLAQGAPVYGLTTGLGANVVHRLPREVLSEFSTLTIRGRSAALGPRLPSDVVRAILLVRLNGLLVGASGSSPALAEAFAALLNERLHPVMPSIGSVGAGDLCLMAHIGLAMIGEGEVECGGTILPAAEALARAGMAPVELGPKDGLTICNSSAGSAGRAALAVHDAAQALALANVSAALGMEGFRANPSPLDPRAAAVRPQPGQAETAAEVRNLLEGSALTEPGAARRLQDPISLRCIAPVHGALKAALDFAQPALEADLNGDSSNPAVYLDTGDLLSNGNFHTPLLTIAFDTVTQALAQVATLSLARTCKQLTERLSDLPGRLSQRGPTRSGFAPLLKPAEALLAEINHLALPAQGGLSLSAEGVEDHNTHAPQAAYKLAEAVWRLRLILAIELIVAAQAVEMRGVERLGHGTARALSAVRDAVQPLDDDRAWSGDIEHLEATLLANGRLLDLVREHR